MVVTIKAVIASFGGKLLKLSHMATSTRCEMAFNLYLPPQAFEEPQKKIPVLIYLSGLTCTADNCSEKGFFQHGASKNGIAVLYPDTSPSTIILFLTGYFFSAHCTMLESLLGIEPQSLPQGYGHEVADTFIGGLNIPGENDSWDFGTGAGFYVDATQQPFNEVYNMYTYVKEELPNVVFQEFPELDPKRVSITGHSMGGHGALMLVCFQIFCLLGVELAGVIVLLCSHRDGKLINGESFFAIPANTDLSLPLRRFVTQSTVLGVKKHFRGISERSIRIYGENMIQPNW